MRHFVKEALESALGSAEHDCTIWTEALNRLRKDKGNPREIERREQWLAQSMEAVLQLREALAADSHEHTGPLGQRTPNALNPESER